MATAKTSRRYETKADDSGLISVPVDVCHSDGSALERRSFCLSTAEAGCVMRADDLQALGFDPSAPVTLPFIRLGVYDFFNIPVTAGGGNVLGAGVLKWLNFSVSNSENAFDADLIDRLKQIVEKGVNPNIKPSALSRVKSSAYNDNGNWMTWEEIDRRFPNSWVLMLAAEGDDEPDLGGEVLWQSENDIPDTSQASAFLYCNKSVAASKPFMVAYEDYIRCRGFAKPDQSFQIFVEELEAKLVSPVVNRFYYDTVSRQGKLYMVRKPDEAPDHVNPNAVLTQAAIDALFAQYAVS